MKISDIDKLVPRISDDANYWLFRTESGKLFNSFLDNNIITIGYKDITISEILAANSGDKKTTIDNIKRIAEAKYPAKARPGLIASQLYRFAYELKKDDYVIIPFAAASKIAIGIIVDNKLKKCVLRRRTSIGYEVVVDHDKSIEVNWIKVVERKDFNLKLYQLFLCHQAIANANEYSFWIDTLIHDLYCKDGNYIFTINIKKEKISAYSLYESQYKIIKSIEDYCSILRFDFDVNSIELSINLNSPGKETLKTVSLIGLIFFGLLIIGVNGGEFEFNATILSGKMRTPGLIQRLNEMNISSSHSLLDNTVAEKIKELEIQDPVVISEILRAVDSDNKMIEK